VTSLDELPELAPYLPDLGDLTDALETVAPAVEDPPAEDGA
jgi:hypothetical protein